MYIISAYMVYNILLYNFLDGIYYLFKVFYKDD